MKFNILKHKNSVLRHSSQLGLSTVYVILLATINHFLLAKYLEAKYLALYTQIYTFAQFFGLLNFSLPTLAHVEGTKLKLKQKDWDLSELLNCTFFISVLFPCLTLILFFSLHYFFNYFHNIDTVVFYILVIHLPLNLAHIWFINTAIRIWNRFSLQAKCQVYVASIFYPSLTILAYSGNSTWVLYALPLQHFLALLIYWNKFPDIRKSYLSIATTLKYLKKVLPLWGSALSSTLLQISEVLLLSFISITHDSEMMIAQFAVASKLIELLSRAIFVINPILLTKFKELVESHSDSPQLVHFFIRSLKIPSLVSAIISLIACIIYGEFIRIFFEQYHQSIVPMFLLTLSFPFIYIVTLCSSFWLNLEKYQLQFRFYSVLTITSRP